MVNPMQLAGRHVVVAGATSGIGSEVARLASCLGARVSLIGRDMGRLGEVAATLEGEAAGCFLADFSEPDSVELAVSAARGEGGPVDGAVYSAGVKDVRPLRGLKPGKLAESAAVNYLSFVEFARCATKKGVRAEKGSVVGISSVQGARGAAGDVAYCSTKSAMDGAMRAMAHELASVGVRVNNVAPGWVRTAMFDEHVAKLGEDGLAREFEAMQYMGAPLEPIDVANAVCFLLSDASRFVTGTTMVVAGGYLS